MAEENVIDWLGKLPDNWNTARINGVYELRAQKVSDNDYSPLSVTKQGILPQLDTVAKTNAHDDRKLVRKGDFAINSRSDRRGSCGISDYDGSVSLINTVMKPRGEMCPKYYDWLFHTTQFADEFYKWGHGIVDDLWTTNWQDMKKITIPLPPLKEQNRIADFLDNKCAEIDAISSEIQEQINTLEEYKRSVITEAVTKGLDPNVEMKDSGIEWLGQIPKDWDVKPIRYLVSEHINGSWGCDSKDNENDRICVRIADFNFSQMRLKEDIEYTIRNYGYSDIHNKTLKKGDLLIEKSGGGEKTPVGRTVVFRLDKECLFANFMDCIRLNDNYSFEYAKYCFYALYKNGITNLYYNKTTGLQNLNIQKYFREVKLPFPSLKEQGVIADFLDSKCAEIDSSIEDKQKQIEVLESYKKSLIYEYVTGKKEVV